MASAQRRITVRISSDAGLHGVRIERGDPWVVSARRKVLAEDEVEPAPGREEVRRKGRLVDADGSTGFCPTS